MPDPLSHEEFNTLKRIGILEVKMKETNQSERRLILMGFAEEVFGRLALTDEGIMRIALGI